jgi:hypothetical protein
VQPGVFGQVHLPHGAGSQLADYPIAVARQLKRRRGGRGPEIFCVSIFRHAVTLKDGPRPRSEAAITELVEGASRSLGLRKL